MSGMYVVRGRVYVTAEGPTLEDAIRAYREAHDGSPDEWEYGEEEGDSIIAWCESCGKPIGAEDGYYFWGGDDPVETCLACGGDGDIEAKLIDENHALRARLTEADGSDHVEEGCRRKYPWGFGECDRPCCNPPKFVRTLVCTQCAMEDDVSIPCDSPGCENAAQWITAEQRAPTEGDGSPAEGEREMIPKADAWKYCVTCAVRAGRFVQGPDRAPTDEGTET